MSVLRIQFRKLISFFFILIALQTNSSNAQSDSLSIDDISNCVDIASFCSKRFSRYIETNEGDSASMIIEYWARRCAVDEALQRAVILFALNYHTYHDSILDENIIDWLTDFRDRMEFKRAKPEIYSNNYLLTFDDFTLKTAARLIAEYREGTVEYSLCKFYSGNTDSVIAEIQKPWFAGTSIQRNYLEELHNCTKLIDFGYAGIGGVWIPRPSATKLGIHPELGIQGGVITNLMTYDISLIVRFLNTPRPYSARRTHTTGLIDNTSHFFGGYIGFDVGRMIHRYQSTVIQMLAGAGYDGFEVFPHDENFNDDEDNSSGANSYNFNFGVGLRHYLRKGIWLGLQAKYNVVDYTLNNVVEFSGNTISIRFLVGGLYGERRYCVEKLQH